MQERERASVAWNFTWGRINSFFQPLCVCLCVFVCVCVCVSVCALVLPPEVDGHK